MAHRKWVQDALEKTTAKQDRRWTDMVAFGSGQFVERVKRAMRIMASGRSIRGFDDSSVLPEAQWPYKAINGPENRDIDPIQACLFIFLIIV